MLTGKSAEGKRRFINKKMMLDVSAVSARRHRGIRMGDEQKNNVNLHLCIESCV